MIENFKRIECDLCGASLEYKEREHSRDVHWYDRETGKEIPKWKHQQISVVFLTEQNEGTPTKPYFDTNTLDMCPNCYEKLLKSYPIVATGAQGYNKYDWRKNTD